MEMAPTSVRRSGRTINLPKRFRSPSPSPQSPRIKKRRSPLSLRSTRTKVIAAAAENKRSIRYISNASEPRVRKSHFVEDFASDSDEEEEEEETISEEHIHPSADNFEYNASDPLDKRASLDSRLDSGNEDYDRDGFVVDDDSEDDVSDVASAITNADLDDIGSDANSDDTATQELVVEQCHLSISSASTMVRRDSATSTKSTDSGLFVHDPNEKHSSLSRRSVTDLLPNFQVLEDDIDPVDVAEEILDATCRFSRRCNNQCVPLQVVLTTALLDDEEVCDAMQRASSRD